MQEISLYNRGVGFPRVRGRGRVREEKRKVERKRQKEQDSKNESERENRTTSIVYEHCYRGASRMNTIPASIAR